MTQQSLLVPVHRTYLLCYHYHYHYHLHFPPVSYPSSNHILYQHESLLALPAVRHSYYPRPGCSSWHRSGLEQLLLLSKGQRSRIYAILHKGLELVPIVHSDTNIYIRPSPKGHPQTSRLPLKKTTTKLMSSVVQDEDPTQWEWQVRSLQSILGLVKTYSRHDHRSRVPIPTRILASHETSR